jgi:hypothetical protein
MAWVSEKPFLVGAATVYGEDRPMPKPEQEEENTVDR